MELAVNYVVSFFVVFVISSFCVAIGIGGGILYVPILGFLYSGVTKGVYLSKVSILVTSFIGATYHLSNDIAAVIRLKRQNKLQKKEAKFSNSQESLKDKQENESKSDPEAETGKYDDAELLAKHISLSDDRSHLLQPKPELEPKATPKLAVTPRIHMALSLSLVPFCLMGSYIGTTYHFFAHDHLKRLLTIMVSICLGFTILKLIFILIDHKLLPDEGTVSTSTESQSSYNEFDRFDAVKYQSVSENVDVNTELKSNVKSTLVAEDVKISYKEGESDNQEPELLFNPESKTNYLRKILGIFRAYTNENVHDLDVRVISFLMIVFCMMLYYLAIRIDNSYTYLSTFLVLSFVSLLFSVKTRMSFRPLNPNDRYTGLWGKVNRKMDQTWFSKVLNTGIHYIIMNIAVAFLCGFFSGSVGTGSGIFMIPLLQLLSVSPVSCTATSNFLTMIMSIATLSRFGLKVEFKFLEFLPALLGSFAGTSISLFMIRTFTKDKITATFVNLTLALFCVASIVMTWTI